MQPNAAITHYALPIFLAVCLGGTAWSNQPPLESTPSLDVIPGLENFTLKKSDFIDNARFGKDPFFPKSGRRLAQRAASGTNEPAQFIGDLTLRGISGPRSRRLCIINGRTFAVGEVIEMKVKSEWFKVECTEIKEKSAIVTVNGVSKELPLTQR